VQVPATLASISRGNIITDSAHPFMISLAGVGAGPGGANFSDKAGGDPLTVGILIDMDARTCVIVNHDAPREGAIRLDGIPARCKLALQGPKHMIKARIVSADVPAGGVERGPAARYSKVPTRVSFGALLAAAAAESSGGGGGAGGGASVRAMLAKSRGDAKEELKGLLARHCDAACFKKVWKALKEEEVTSVAVLAVVDADEIADEHGLKLGPRGALHAAVASAREATGLDEHDDDDEGDVEEEEEVGDEDLDLGSDGVGAWSGRIFVVTQTVRHTRTHMHTCQLRGCSELVGVAVMCSCVHGLRVILSMFGARRASRSRSMSNHPTRSRT
jgi:hypothetical protein